MSMFLSVLDEQVDVIRVDGLCVNEHMLVDICMPVKYILSTDPIYI